MEECNDKIKFTGYEIIKPTMKKPEPEPEPEPKYPCMMTLVGCDGLDFIDVVQGVFLGKYMVKDPNDDKMFHAFDVAKPLPTTTITTEELIEFYEKNTNTKVILSN
jgi:hypothetical protein